MIHLDAQANEWQNITALCGAKIEFVNVFAATPKEMVTLCIASGSLSELMENYKVTLDQLCDACVLVHFEDNV